MKLLAYSKVNIHQIIKNKTIFLDFDGVLFDTAKEAHLIARYAYRNISAFDKIAEEEYSKLYQNKYLVTNSGSILRATLGYCHPKFT